jgi:hypothetical protein
VISKRARRSGKEEGDESNGLENPPEINNGSGTLEKVAELAHFVSDVEAEFR